MPAPRKTAAKVAKAAPAAPRKRAARKTPAAPVRVDPVTDYARAVVAGTILAGPNVRDECKRHLADLEAGPLRGLTWDLEAADRALEFFRVCLTVEVRGETVPFVLLDWQAFIVGSLFGWKGRDGFRRFREAYIETGKGSGKSPLAAGVGLYMLLADNEPRAEVYAAASKRDQAAVLFRDAVAMWRRMPAKLRDRVTPAGGAGMEWNLAVAASQSFFRMIASEGGQSGPRPHGALLDEIHEHESDAMVKLMRAGTKGRRQALMFMITNSGAGRAGVCWEYHEYAGKVSRGDVTDDSFFSFVCALDIGDKPLTDESCWAKANPSIGQTFQPSYLRELVNKARGMPSSESVVLRLNFCVWTDAESPWIDRDLWDGCQSDAVDLEALRPYPCFLGVDLSSKRDLTAVSAVWVLPDGSGVAVTWYWSPGDTLAERARLDSAAYPLWKEQGHLFAPPGRVVDKKAVALFIQGLCQRYDVRAMAYDQALADDFMTDCDELGFDVWIDDRKRDESGEPIGPDGAGLRMVRHGQGFAGYQSDHVLWMPRSISGLEDAIIAGRLTIQANPVTRSCSASAVLLSDASGNRKWDKRKSTGRIDGMLSLTMAHGAAQSGTPPRRGSIWSRDDLWQ
jgi:phage terminase large subunit-like protein